MDDDLALALQLANLADRITLPRFRNASLRVETKADATWVTEADRLTERTLRDTLRQARPGDLVVGEEYGSEGGESERRWLLDPIDGTSNYVRGVPVWATLIAMERAGRVDVGVVSAPALGRRWWAARGSGAMADGTPIHVSPVDRLERAQLSCDGVADFEQRGLGEQFLGLARRCWRTRGFGDFWSHVLVAEGAVDVALEAEVNPWDLAALLVIVEEAGGRLTDLHGDARIDGGSVVTSNGLLHDEVLAALRP